jgi:hypothetical protein
MEIGFDSYQTQLERIFVYYCSFADKDNHSHLKIQNYRRLLGDLHLNNHHTLISQFDLIFCSRVHPNGMELGTFIKSLKSIAALAFQGGSESEKVQRLLTQHLQPLYDVILKDTEFGHSIAFLSVSLLT